MGAVVKTMTPFIDQKFLVLALESLGFSYSLQGKDIVTERVNYYGQPKFVWAQGQYLFQHDSSATLQNYGWRNVNFKEYKTVGSFMFAVSRACPPKEGSSGVGDRFAVSPLLQCV